MRGIAGAVIPEDDGGLEIHRNPVCHQGSDFVDVLGEHPIITKCRTINDLVKVYIDTVAIIEKLVEDQREEHQKRFRPISLCFGQSSYKPVDLNNFLLILFGQNLDGTIDLSNYAPQIWEDIDNLNGFAEASLRFSNLIQEECTFYPGNYFETGHAEKEEVRSNDYDIPPEERDLLFLKESLSHSNRTIAESAHEALEGIAYQEGVNAALAGRTIFKIVAPKGYYERKHLYPRFDLFSWSEDFSKAAQQGFQDTRETLGYNEHINLVLPSDGNSGFFVDPVLDMLNEQTQIFAGQRDDNEVSDVPHIRERLGELAKRAGNLIQNFNNEIRTPSILKTCRAVMPLQLRGYWLQAEHTLLKDFVKQDLSRPEALSQIFLALEQGAENITSRTSSLLTAGMCQKLKDTLKLNMG